MNKRYLVDDLELLTFDDALVTRASLPRHRDQAIHVAHYENGKLRLTAVYYYEGAWWHHNETDACPKGPFDNEEEAFMALDRYYAERV